MTDRTPTVVHIGPGGVEGRGGMGRFLCYLVPELSSGSPRYGHRVLDSYGTAGFARMPMQFLGCLVKLGAALARGEVAIVHLHMASHGSVIRKATLGLMAQAMNVPVVVHVHAAGFDRFMDGLPPPLRRLATAWLRRCDRVIVIGRYWRRYAIEGLGLPPGRVVLVPNGVPDPAKHAVPRQQRHGPARIVCLGELGPRKGTPALLRALAHPLMRGLDWQAVIAGDGAVAEAREEVARLGLADRVRLPGWVDRAEAWRLLAEADVFVLPSHDEGLPMAILEAMAMELPVVSTPVGAIPDAVVPEESGLLVAPGDADALAQALAALVGDAALRRRLGAAGRAAFHARFSIRRTAAALDALYDEILSGDTALRALPSRPGEQGT